MLCQNFLVRNWNDHQFCMYRNSEDHHMTNFNIDLDHVISLYNEWVDVVPFLPGLNSIQLDNVCLISDTKINLSTERFRYAAAAAVTLMIMSRRCVSYRKVLIDILRTKRPDASHPPSPRPTITNTFASFYSSTNREKSYLLTNKFPNMASYGFLQLWCSLKYQSKCTLST